jgi:nucleotide-binding universal stress UspA family protein
MFKHILVPLDGSELAESVIPAAAYFAGIFEASITLIHIIEKDASPVIHGEHHLTQPQEAEAYLNAIGRRFFAAGPTVTTHVHTAATKDVARGIAAHQSELTVDLIVMCTHGRSGLRGILFGSIAQQVVASGQTPVLLIRPEAVMEKKAFACRRLLAPTDGNPAHAAGLTAASGLARAAGAQLMLLAVVPTVARLSGKHATTQRFMPGTIRAALDLDETNLQSYLQQLISDLENEGIPAFARVSHGDPASVIAQTADERQADVIVLATHGKSGTKAFWAGSVAAKVLGKTVKPLLLVPFQAKTQEKEGPPRRSENV